MAYTSLSHDGNSGIWDFSVEVEELSSSGLYRRIRLAVSVNTKDFTAGRNGSFSVSCAEANYSRSWSGTMPGSSQAKEVLMDEEFDVYVEPGSTTASINFEATVEFTSPSTGTRPTATARITSIQGLTVVADSAISSAKDIYFGDNCSITWTPPSSSFTYKLHFSMGDYSYTTGVLKPNSTNAYTYNGLVIPESEAVNIPNSEYGIVAVSLTQYSDAYGKESVGASSTASFKITLKDNVIPSITSHNVAIDNSGNSVVNQWGIALAGYTKIRIVADAAGVYGSTIKSFAISGGWYKANVEGSSLDYTGKVIEKSGSCSFIVQCTDSRGRVSEQIVTSSIQFLPYTPPKVLKLSVRKDDGGDSNASNDRMVATSTWTFDSVNNKNSATGKMYYKASTASDWTMHSGVVRNNEPFRLDNLRLSDSISYNFKIVVTDLLGVTSSKDTFSSTTRVLMDYQAGGMGLGIGKICEIDNVANGTQSLEVSMDSYFFGEIYIKDKTRSLEDYIKSLTKYLVAGEDYGEDHPANVIQNPQPGQIYYMKVADG